MHEVSDINALLALIQGGAHPQYLHFWGHTPNSPAGIDKSCLSQWYPAGFEIEGIRYATAEHYMMAEKAECFGDHAVKARILRADSPAAAKRLGREVANYRQDLWVARRFDIVVQGNLAKFGQHADCAAFLLASADKVLVEASPVDAIWGIGLAADHRDIDTPTRWPGLNLLGFALMQVRNQLAKG